MTQDSGRDDRLPASKSEGSAKEGQAPPKQSLLQRYQVLLACIGTLLFHAMGSVAFYFFGVDDRLDEVEDRVLAIELRIDTLDKSMARIETSLDSLDDKVDQVLLELARGGIEVGSTASPERDVEFAD